jgi:hypothetical protein
VALLLLAFLLNLIHKLPPDGVPYAAMNLAGAALACYASWLIEFVPFVVLEGTWAAVALVALVRAVGRYRKHRSASRDAPS